MIIQNTATATATATATDYEYPALCIPRALGEITQQEMRDIINKLGLGDISKIVIKPKEFVLPKWEMTKSYHEYSQQSEESPSSSPRSPQTVCYNNIYIYFKRWNVENPQVRKYRENILKGQTIKIVHKMIPTPIFWRCVAANFTSNNRQQQQQQQPQQQPQQQQPQQQQPQQQPIESK